MKIRLSFLECNHEPLSLDTVDAKIDSYLEGKWGVDDVLEMLVDEMSTSGNVGSGTDRTLANTGNRISDEEHIKKLIASYKKMNEVYEGTDRDCWSRFKRDNGDLSEKLLNSVRKVLFSDGFIL